MKNLFFICLFLFSLSTYSLQVRTLGPYQITKGSELFEGKTLWVLYRLHCSSCLLQMKELTCLKDLSQVRIVGFDANEKSLYKEARRFKITKKLKADTNGPFYGDSDLLKFLGIKQNYSPQVLVFAGQKKLVHHLGALNCQKLRQILL